MAHPQNLREGGAKHIFYSETLREPGNLRNQAQFLVGIDINLAGIVIHLPGQDIKKRCLAAAVAAQNGNALPFLNLKGQVFQQIFANDKEFCQIRYLYIYHGFTPLYLFQNSIQFF